MAITVAWDSEQHTIVRFTFIGRWDWNDFYNASAQSHELIEQVSHNVDLLIDLRNSQMLPENMLSHLNRLPQIAHPNTGAVVIVGANKVMQALSDLYVRVYGKGSRQFRMVKTLDAGRQFLASA